MEVKTRFQNNLFLSFNRYPFNKGNRYKDNAGGHFSETKFGVP